MAAIDTEGRFGKDYDAAWLRQSGINTVLRYISSGEQTKCIDAAELQSLIENSITVGVIYELWGGSKGLPGSIDAANGAADGGYALRTLRSLRVPQRVVVYFAVDTSVDTNDDINGYVVPYYQGAKQALGGYYRIGAYGCGSTCAAALSAAGCDKALLANATSWDGYQTFLNSGRAAIVQGIGPNLYDPDTIRDPDWGGFTALAAAGV